MAIVDGALRKATFWQLLAEKFRSVFISLGLPVIGIALLSILAVLVQRHL